MTELFRLLTPVTYWLLIVMWSFILFFYIKNINKTKTTHLVFVLLLILSIDAFRTLFESVYFGFWYTSLTGMIPRNIADFLMLPEMVIIPKLINVFAAILVIFLLLKKWLPKELKEKQSVRDVLKKGLKDEATIANQKYLLEKAQELGQIGTWELDLINNKLHWTDENCRIFGVPPGTVATYEIFIDKIHPDDREYVNTEWMAGVAGKPYDIEHRLLIDEKIKWVREKADVTFDSDGNALSAIGFTQDITERKNTEIFLRESEKRFNAFTTQSVDGISVADVEGNYTYVNPAFCKMVGYSETELLEMTVFDVTSDTQDKATFKKTKGSKEGTPVEVVLKRKNGEDLLAEVVGNNIEISNENMVLGTIRDITERKRAEEALKESNAKQKALIGNISDVIAIVDETGINLYKSPNIEKWFGWKPSELVGESTWNNIHPEDRERLQILFGELLEKENATVNAEYRYMCKDGNYLWVEATASNHTNNPAINGILLNYHDISERKQAAEALMQSEYFFKETQNAALIGSYESEFTPNDRWVTSEVCDKIFGMGPDYNKTVQGWIDLLHPDSVAEMTRYVMEDVIGNNVPFDKEYKIIRQSDGETRWVWGLGKTIQDEEGNVVGLIGTIQDVTKRKLSEDSLAKTQEMMQSVLDNTRMHIWAFDGTQYLFISKEWFNYTGQQTSTKLTVEMWISAVHPDDVAPSGEIWINNFEAKTEHDNYFRLKKHDGVYQDFHCHAVPVYDAKGIFQYFLGVNSDITNRKQGEEALKDSRKRAKALLSAIPDLMFRLNDEGVYLDYKADENDLYVTASKSIIGKRNRDLTPPAFSNLVDEKVSKTLKSGEMQIFEYQLPIPERGLRDYEARMVKSGEDEVITIVRDISERVQLGNQLRQAQKLEAVGTMVGGISHELNNILQSMFLYGGLVQEELPDKKSLQANMQHLFEDGERARDIVKQILTFSRKSRVDMKPHILHDIILEALMLEQASLPANITLKQDVELSRSLVECDKKRWTPYVGQYFLILRCERSVVHYPTSFLIDSLKYTSSGVSLSSDW